MQTKFSLPLPDVSDERENETGISLCVELRLLHLLSVGHPMGSDLEQCGFITATRSLSLPDYLLSVTNEVPNSAVLLLSSLVSCVSCLRCSVTLGKQRLVPFWRLLRAVWSRQRAGLRSTNICHPSSGVIRVLLMEWGTMLIKSFVTKFAAIFFAVNLG